MLKRGAFIHSASIPFASTICIMDRADQPLPSHLFHHLAWLLEGFQQYENINSAPFFPTPWLLRRGLQTCGAIPVPESISLNFKSWHSTKELSGSHFCTLPFLLKRGWRHRIKVWRRQQAVRGAEKGDQMNTAFQQEKSPITLLFLVRREDIDNMLGRVLPAGKERNEILEIQ